MNPDQTKVCKKSFNDCKTSVKNILAKVGGVKPGGKPKGGKRGGGSKVVAKCIEFFSTNFKIETLDRTISS